MLGIKRLIENMKLERKIIRKFRDTAACSVDFAKSFQEIGVSQSAVLRKLVSRGVIVRGGDGIYFLDEQAYLKFRLDRTKYGMMALFVLLALIALLYINRRPGV